MPTIYLYYTSKKYRRILCSLYIYILYIYANEWEILYFIFEYKNALVFSCERKDRMVCVRWIYTAQSKFYKMSTVCVCVSVRLSVGQHIKREREREIETRLLLFRL